MSFTSRSTVEFKLTLVWCNLHTYLAETSHFFHLAENVDVLLSAQGLE